MKQKEDFETNRKWQDYLLFYYAGLAMQGLLSKYTIKEAADFTIIADTSIEAANQLRTQLNETIKNQKP